MLLNLCPLAQGPVRPPVWRSKPATNQGWAVQHAVYEPFLFLRISPPAEHPGVPVTLVRPASHNGDAKYQVNQAFGLIGQAWLDSQQPRNRARREQGWQAVRLLHAAAINEYRLLRAQGDTPANRTAAWQRLQYATYTMDPEQAAPVWDRIRSYVPAGWVGKVAYQWTRAGITDPDVVADWYSYAMQHGMEPKYLRPFLSQGWTQAQMARVLGLLGHKPQPEWARVPASLAALAIAAGVSAQEVARMYATGSVDLDALRTLAAMRHTGDSLDLVRA